MKKFIKTKYIIGLIGAILKYMRNHLPKNLKIWLVVDKLKLKLTNQCIVNFPMNKMQQKC